MTRCATLDEAVLAKTKTDKVLPRLIKKGDEHVKELAQRVLENAAAISKQKNANGKPVQLEAKDKASKINSIAKPSPVESSRAAGTASGIKKARAPELPAGQPAKKPSNAGTASSGAAPAKSIGFSGKRQQAAKVDPKSVAKATSSIAPISKVKPNHVSAKPSGFFTSLQSASKKPGTSNAALLSAKAREGKDRYVSRVMASPSFF